MGNDVIIIILKHGYGTDPLVYARVLTGRYLSSDVTGYHTQGFAFRSSDGKLLVGIRTFILLIFVAR